MPARRKLTRLLRLRMLEEEQQRMTERQTLEELIRTKPTEVAMLLKSWLASDD